MAGKKITGLTPRDDQAFMSFVIPAYNDAPGLRRHFDYFAARRNYPVEVIVVDDCSDDDTRALCEGIDLPDHVQLVYLRNRENIGPGPSRNAGMEKISGEYAMFLDADDLLTDHFFDYISLSGLGNGADFVMFKYHLCRGMEDRFSYHMHGVDASFFSGLSATGYPLRNFRLVQVPSVLRTINYPWNKVYRTEFLKRAGIRFPDFRMHEDIHPYWRSFLKAHRFGILGWAPPLIHHFENVGGSRATNYVGEQRLQAFDTLRDVYHDIQQHSGQSRLIPEFVDFSEELFGWMIELAENSRNPEEAIWSERYRTARRTLWDELNVDVGRIEDATEFGEFQSMY